MSENYKEMLRTVLSKGEGPYQCIELRRKECQLSRSADVNEVDVDGFIALHYAVQDMDVNSVKLLLEYGAYINASATDGTTPLEIAINNVILYPCTSAKTVLQTLLEYGVDVNVRSSKGRTMLKEAIENNETRIVEKLLYYGANINKKDVLGTFCISSLIKWHEKSNNVQLFLEHTYFRLFYIIFLHVQKLLALGLNVHRKIQKLCRQLHRRYDSLGEEFYDIIKKKYQIDMSNLQYMYFNCTEELIKMKLTKINYCTSLFDVLKYADHSLSKHVRNETLNEIVNDANSFKSFPLYFFLIELKFKKGLIRKNKIELAKKSLNHCIAYNLPDPCSDAILKYLSNKELDSLIAVIEEKV